MDLINSFLNFLLPSLTFLLLFLISPFYLLYALSSCLRRYSHRESVAGKVVLITGASSGIGEHVAYEYARRGARLALFARRKDRLQSVADRSRQLGSPDVIFITGDVSKIDDCKRFVDDTISHFEKLDHLVNNAGVCENGLFEDCTRIPEAIHLMDTNFWGSVYTTHFASPYLRKSKGAIVVIASLAAEISVPAASFYSASKAALLSFFESLRIEFNPDIRVAIVVPGLISTDMTTPHFVEKFGSDILISESAKKCAKAIVDGVCQGATYVTEPYWIKSMFWMKMLCPDVLEWIFQRLYVHIIKNHLKEK